MKLGLVFLGRVLYQYKSCDKIGKAKFCMSCSKNGAFFTVEKKIPFLVQALFILSEL